MNQLQTQYYLYIQSNKKSSEEAKKYALSNPKIEIIDINKNKNYPSYIRGTPYLLDLKSNQYLTGTNALEKLKELYQILSNFNSTTTTNTSKSLKGLEPINIKQDESKYMETGKLTVAETARLIEEYEKKRNSIKPQNNQQEEISSSYPTRDPNQKPKFDFPIPPDTYDNEANSYHPEDLPYGYQPSTKGKSCPPGYLKKAF